MPTITQAEIRENAQRFVHEWRDEVAERAEAQTFWNEFFEVFGVKRRKKAAFEKAVKKVQGNWGRIDLFWTSVLLVEHKSRDQSLDKAALQAFDYITFLPDNEAPRYVLVSDFARFRLFDLDENTEIEFGIDDLPNQIARFGFISGWEKRTYEDQDPINIEVANKLADLHNELRNSGYGGHDLEVFLIRVVYCLFADDTGIFPKDHFRVFLDDRTNENGSDTGTLLNFLFNEVLNRAPEDRQAALDDDLQQFDYVNGNLFAEEIRTPVFNRAMREILLEACRPDWSKVSPAIFGSLFQHVMTNQERRVIGAHYTSEKNISKIVRGLFLDDLRRDFEGIKFNVNRLQQFRTRLSRMRFFDPACGCGNFLVITYREMRLLELDVLKQIRQLRGQEEQEILFEAAAFSLIDVDAFYGIEIEEFASQVAQVALWITDHLMNEQFSLEFGRPFRRLPLLHHPNIVNDNALRRDWNEVLGIGHPEGELFVLGNPPFIGKKVRSAQQNVDMRLICGAINNSGILDYVACWYVKATQMIRNSRIKVGFVSTNSITQGEQVGVLWRFLLNEGIDIHFAHRTFKWMNEAAGMAAVHCVIIGFAAFIAETKRLFDYETPTSDPQEIRAGNISPYLIDFDNLLILNRNQPISDVPELVFGNMPNDDGNLLLSDEERDELLRLEPAAARFIRPLISARQFIHGINRWCLWLQDSTPAEINAMPLVRQRVQAVREYRLGSNRAATRGLAEIPYLFGEIRQPTTAYILIPLHSSEHRRYIPLAFRPPSDILNNSCSAMPDATLFHFGILNSQMHMAWMRQVCGRLESRYRYSNKLVYNNFPFPEDITERQRQRVTAVSQAVLDTRDRFPDEPLANLYDTNLMPQPLVQAHRDLDLAVDRCYRRAVFNSELARLTFLFERYRQITEPLNL